MTKDDKICLKIGSFFFGITIIIVKITFEVLTFL
jgi:hypothetical protein